MKIINQLFYIAPTGIIVDFDTNEVDIAMRVQRDRALDEDPNSKPLRYYDDPLIVQPSFLIVGVGDHNDDIVDHDVDDVPSWVIWQGADEKYYMVQSKDCYRVQNEQCLV